MDHDLRVEWRGGYGLPAVDRLTDCRLSPARATAYRRCLRRVRNTRVGSSHSRVTTTTVVRPLGLIAQMATPPPPSNVAVDSSLCASIPPEGWSCVGSGKRRVPTVPRAPWRVYSR
jgi:hypothetical protein